MAQVESQQARSLEKDEFRAFEEALKTAYDDAWWRKFVQIFKDRRIRLLEDLALPSPDRSQRMEDVLRGQIQENAAVIALDDIAKRLKEAEKETANASRSERDNGSEGRTQTI